MYEIELRKIEDAIVAILPPEMVERLQVGDGGVLLAMERNGEFILSAYDPDLMDTMRAFEEIRREYANALRALAD